MADLVYPVVRSTDLEPHFSRHMEAMTRENLVQKAEIAVQLALRDKRLEEAESIIRDLLKRVNRSSAYDTARDRARKWLEGDEENCPRT